MIRPLLAAILIFCAAIGLAQENTAPTVKLLLPAKAKAGAKVQATVVVTFAEGLHAYQNPPTSDYQIPVKVTLDSKTFTMAKPAYPKGVMLSIGGDPTPAGVYEGTIKIPVVITLPKKAGASEVKVTVSYQQCNDQACFPPSTVSATAKLTITK